MGTYSLSPSKKRPNVTCSCEREESPNTHLRIIDTPLDVALSPLATVAPSVAIMSSVSRLSSSTMRLARASRRPMGQVRFAHGEAEHAHHGGPAPYGVRNLRQPLLSPSHLSFHFSSIFPSPSATGRPSPRSTSPSASRASRCRSSPRATSCEFPSPSHDAKGEGTNLMCSLGGSRADRPLHERVISYCECSLRTRHRV